MKDSKTVRSGDPNPKKQTFSAEKHISTIKTFLHHHCEEYTDAKGVFIDCFNSICCRGSLLHILI
jgi:hypothetical protein